MPKSRSRGKGASDSKTLKKTSSLLTRNLPPKEILDALPENVRVSVMEASAFSGPLPPPSMYSGYEKTLPGSAERILAMAEKEQAHRFSWEDRALNANALETKRGQWFGFAMGIVCIFAAVVLAMSGREIVAGILAGIGAIGLVARFLEKK